MSCARTHSSPDGAVRIGIAASLRSPSLVDWPGRMAAVLLVPRCNLRCGYCHNRALLELSADPMPSEVLGACLARFRELWVDAVVLSGGEPTLADDLPEVIGRLRSAGFRVKLDTNGTRPDRLAEVIGELDYVAMDLKCAPHNYPARLGWAAVDRLQESAELIRRCAPDYEFRTTVVPGWHDDAEMDAIADWARGARRWVLQAFEPREDLPDPALRQTPRTPAARLRELRDRYRGLVNELLVRGDEPAAVLSQRDGCGS
ncbi:MAG: anaerobic ribonucleoside-triphosphate reductase activating protein [Kiritimatiellae bacterium]|nr:anaerobic ribonucleoside-triphosphate reductase activating protein [Kiritimatiellia bacterium]